MGNIYYNNTNKVNLRLTKSDYWDICLSDDKSPFSILDGSYLYDDNLISFIDISNSDCILNNGKSIISTDKYKYNKSFNHGLKLFNYGYHGIDNGIINFDINSVTKNDFINILTGNTDIVNNELIPYISIEENNVKLQLNAISGNTGDYVYPLEYVNDNYDKYIKLDGGFYQGFFKHQDIYSVLPHVYESEINFEFILKPDFISEPNPNTLNEKYPNNKGIFFYIGPKSENKFWYLYKTKQYDFEISKENQEVITTNDDIENVLLTNNFNLKTQNVFDIKNDNNFLLYNRTKTGLLSGYKDDSVEYHVTGKTKNDVNLYEYLNRTKTGYTVNNINEIESIEKEYDIIKDIANNNISFLIRDNGSIGYRMLTFDCETATGNTFKIIEEYSTEEIIRNNETIIVNIKLSMSESNSGCYNTNRTMRILFYVNGYLVFKSKELPEIKFREFNDMLEKQEGVPFNISLGGGTQGLSDMIGLSENYETQYLLPIEKYFAGSFIGNLYQFRIYYGNLDYSKIKNNYKYLSDNVLQYNYVLPYIEFNINGLNILSPETNYKREVGNTYSSLSGLIKLNDVYTPISSYKLYYCVDYEDVQPLNGLFPIAASGGTINEYIHDSLELKTSGAKKIKYIIEVLDSKRNNPGTQIIKTVEFDNMIFYGTSQNIPTIGEDIRNLENKVFNSETNEFILNTGTENSTFVIAVPNNREIYSILDLDAFMLEISYLFTVSTISVPDAGGKLSDYKVYILKNAIPYSRNHKLKVKIN